MVRDFDAWRQARQPEPIQFRLGGVEFSIPRRLNNIGFFDYVSRQQVLLDKLEAAKQKAIAEGKPLSEVSFTIRELDDDSNWSFLHYMLAKADFEKIKAVCLEQCIDFETIGALVEFISEEASGRPLENQPDLEPSPTTVGTNSQLNFSPAESTSTASQSARRSTSSTPSRSKLGTTSRKRS